MKKLCFVNLILFFCVILSSCSQMPNMDTLLAYQKEGAEMDLRITDGSSFSAHAEYIEGGVRLTFTEGDAENISYVSDENGNIRLTYDGIDISISDDTCLKCADWFSLLILSPAETIWKIKKENLGGTDVYVCSDQNGTIVYIDAIARIPLKFKAADLEIDVTAYRQDSN